VKGIAVMAAKRAPIIADLATTGEQGSGGRGERGTPSSSLKGTPDAIVRKLTKAMSDTTTPPRKRLESSAQIMPPEHRTPEYLAKFAGGDRALGEADPQSGISVD
jgi:tripartite-type tricarboxylate transporter receptor subunit TctC